MDSGNSGSMQSSSGGDEEYDSRAESISVFLNNNNNPLTHVGPMPNPPPPPQPPPPPSNHHHHHHHHQTHQTSSSSMFDPLSNYFDPLSSSRSPPPQFTNPNSLVNLDMVWSKNLRSDSNCTDLAGFIPSSSSPTQQFFTNNHPQTRTNFSPLQIPQAPESGMRGSASASGSGSNNQTNNTTATGRNPKKRSRASRRAPTTVLTTDTTNFRAMVQEFTGIPAPPFTSSHFPRSRLDLFGTSSSLRSATHLESPPPPYLLRPFAQKIQPPPLFLSSSASSSSPSMVDAIASTTTTNLNSATNPTTATSSSTALSSELGLLKQPHNLLNINMQNPVLNFDSLLQPSPKFPLPNSAILGGAATNDSHLKMGLLDEYGLSHGSGHVNTNLTGLQNMVSSSSSDTHTTLRISDQNNWGGDHVADNQGLLRSINSNNYNNSHRVATNGKVINYSASSSDFHGEKGPENVASRTEGSFIYE